MKKPIILIACALMLAACSAPADSTGAASPAASAEASAEAAAAPSADSSADGSGAAGSPAAPAAASGPKISKDSACTEMLAFLNGPSAMPGGGNDAEVAAVEASMSTLPDRAPEELKTLSITLSKLSEVSFADVKNGTRELDEWLSDPAAAEAYRKALTDAGTLCGYRS